MNWCWPPAAGGGVSGRRYGSFGTGLIPPTEEEWRGLVKLRSVFGGLDRGAWADQSVDNSDTQYFPPIGNQGSKGACAAFSFGYYVHTYTMARENGWDLSTATWNDPPGFDPGAPALGAQDKIISPDFIYHQINRGVDNGTSLWAAGSLLVRMGGGTWDLTPYDYLDATTWPSEAAYRAAARYRAREAMSDLFGICSVGYFVIESDADINLLKDLLAAGYCAATEVRTAPDGDYPGIYEYLDGNDVIEYDGTMRSAQSDHAQTIVGFKDGAAWDKTNPDL